MSELFDIVGNEYLKKVEEGKIPKNVDVEDLIEWIKSKPVNYRRANVTLTLNQLRKRSKQTSTKHGEQYKKTHPGTGN